jgi:microcystin-dependent protein
MREFNLSPAPATNTPQFLEWVGAALMTISNASREDNTPEQIETALEVLDDYYTSAEVDTEIDTVEASITALSAAVTPHLVPVGTVANFVGTSAPTGWLLCYGQSLLRADYTALFAVIGTTFGAADGTHFNLPDCRGRVIAGKDDMGGSSANRLTNQTGGLNGDTLGATGGAETHTLLQTQLPVVDFSHSLTTSAAIVSLNSQATGSSGAQKVVSGNTSALTVSGTVSSGGSATPFNIVQPTIILQVIIHAGV